MKINYNVKMKSIIENLSGKRSLLLHSCCAPCTTYPLEFLSLNFNVTLLFYNPNITDRGEYFKRLDELKAFVRKRNLNIKILEREYNPDEFYAAVKGLEHCAEGGERCYKCYELRLNEAALTAKNLKLEFFTTVLSISPYKNSGYINDIGQNLEKKHGVKYLYADFKKDGGYQKSIENSKKYGLYRQDYCGCEFSRKSSEDTKIYK